MKKKRKSRENLLNIFVREMVGMRNILNELADEDIDNLFELNPELGHSYLVISDLLEWADIEFDTRRRSRNFYKTQEYKEFMKFHAQLCYDCGEDDIDYYMVKNDLWDAYGAGDYYLCISCLEKRLGRKLGLKDFTECGANDSCEYVKNLRNEKWRTN